MIRYLPVYGDVHPMFQRSDGATTAARRLLPLTERDGVHAELAKALDVEASAGRGWRGTQAADLGSAKLGRAIRLRLVLACRGLRSFSLRSHGLHLPFNHHLRASLTGSSGWRLRNLERCWHLDTRTSGVK